MMERSKPAATRKRRIASLSPRDTRAHSASHILQVFMVCCLLCVLTSTSLHLQNRELGDSNLKDPTFAPPYHNTGDDTTAIVVAANVPTKTSQRRRTTKTTSTTGHSPMEDADAVQKLIREIYSEHTSNETPKQEEGDATTSPEAKPEIKIPTKSQPNEKEAIENPASVVGKQKEPKTTVEDSTEGPMENAKPNKKKEKAPLATEEPTSRATEAKPNEKEEELLDATEVPTSGVEEAKPKKKAPKKAGAKKTKEVKAEKKGKAKKGAKKGVIKAAATEAPTPAMTVVVTLSEEEKELLQKQEREEERRQCLTQQEALDTARQLRKVEEKQEPKTNASKNDAVLVIASVLMEERHAIALWSELECFAASSFSHVIISTAFWAKPLVSMLVDEARRSIPHFASGDVTIEVNTYDNKKYDAGLWCDALMGVKSRFKRFGLLNDSIFALKPFDGVMETLETHNRSMTSLSYHIDETPMPWVESIFRGFDQKGIEVFMDRSCVPVEHGSFCPKELNKARKKRCIVEYFEVGMAWQFPDPKTDVEGLFPGTVPEDFRKTVNNFATWVCNRDFWTDVLLPQGFPAAKVNCKAQIEDISDPLLDTCTAHLDRKLLCEMDFSGAQRMIEYPGEEIKIRKLGLDQEKRKR